MGTDMSFLARGGKDDWQSPPSLIEPIEEHDGIDVDPCAGPTTDIGTRNIRPPENGLEVAWETPDEEHPTVYLNPPFSMIEDWLAEAVDRYRAGKVERVYVVSPDSTDVADWWHEYIAQYCRWTWFATSRINYIDPEDGEQKSGVSFNTAVSVLGDTLPFGLRQAWQSSGDPVRRYIPEENR